ncbi:hypothetical protein SNE40_014589 [Patella caerulea]|uniref:Endonuclease/exonuclease/phosphatase domain-containing protein n=1 Tax=Patella caerulea TaxID=87958 RepID=A0AAN8PD69_PATCE
MDGKVGALCSSILSHHTDVLMISESWMTNEKVAFADAHLASSISGFTSHHAPRANRRGGGLALLVRSNLKVTKNKCSSYQSMEVMDYNIRSGNELLHIVLIYRPPYSSKHKVPISCYLYIRVWYTNGNPVYITWLFNHSWRHKPAHG